MPNWTSCTLRCNPEDFMKLQTLLHGLNADGELSTVTFNTVVPMPAYINRGDLSAEDCMLGWYDWSIEHWGTKWDACEPYVDTANSAVYFDTAWSAPEAWFKELCGVAYLMRIRDLTLTFELEEEPCHYYKLECDDYGDMVEGETEFDEEAYRELHADDEDYEE